MAEYLYLYRSGNRPGTPEQMQQTMQKWMDWMKELGAKGHLKDAGHPLEGGGKVVHAKSKINDGPYAETKDLIGGYSLIEAKDLSHAAELSQGCPILSVGGMVEIRPIMKNGM